MITCPNCRQENPDDAQRCAKCRLDLDQALMHPELFEEKGLPVPSAEVYSERGLMDKAEREREAHRGKQESLGTPMKFKRKIYETREEKRGDFLEGFIGWIVINALLLALAWIISEAASSRYHIIIWGLPLLLNVGGLTLLGFKRKWVVLGALAAFGILLVLGLCALGALLAFLDHAMSPY